MVCKHSTINACGDRGVVNSTMSFLEGRQHHAVRMCTTMSAPAKGRVKVALTLPMLTITPLCWALMALPTSCRAREPQVRPLGSGHEGCSDPGLGGEAISSSV